MHSEIEQLLTPEANLMPRKLICGITNPDYLGTLKWGKTIKVTNFIPTVEYDSVNPYFFRYNYLRRQSGLIEKLQKAGSFIADNNLQTPNDIKHKHKEFLQTFVRDVGVFFSETLHFSLKSKKAELSVSPNRRSD